MFDGPSMSSRTSDRKVALRRATVLIACACLAAMTGAQAAEPPTRSNVEITPFLGYMAGGEFEDPSDRTERDLDADTSFGLLLDFAADDWRHYEVLYSNLGTTVDGVSEFDMDVQYLHIGGTVNHPEATRFIPYFAGSLGATMLSPDEAGLDDETKVSFSLGGVVRVPITDHIGVRFDARAFLTLLDSDGDLFCTSVDGSATCRIAAKSDTFLQYAASLGVMISF